MASSASGGDFIGRGFAFPFSFDPRNGGTAKDQGSGITQRLQRILWAVMQILGVDVGEMFMSRTYGSGLRGLIGRPNDASIITLAEYATTQAIERWEKRIRLNAVVIAPDPVNVSQLNINLNYTIRQTNVSGNLVYPYYLADDQRDTALRSQTSPGM